MAKAVAVYIGKAVEHRMNFEFGVDNGAWGFPKDQWDETFAGAEYVLFGWNFKGNIRSVQPSGDDSSMDLLLVGTDSKLYRSEAPFWPDEISAGYVKYVQRVGLTQIVGGAHAQIDAGGPLTEDVAKALSLLTTGGVARAVDIDPTQFTTAYESIDLFAGSSGSLKATSETTPGLKPGNGPGRVRDAKRRMAIEERSLVVTETYLRSRGAKKMWRLGKPYDINCDIGGQEIHVEVKGTSGPGAIVKLTRNEVKHANQHTTWLAIVNDIKLEGPRENPSGTGGRLRVWEDWVPDPKSLSPYEYEYVVP